MDGQKQVIEQGVGRRSFMRGAAVVGGTVWVTPTIQSIVASAAAASGHCQGYFLSFKYEVDGNRFDPGAGNPCIPDEFPQAISMGSAMGNSISYRTPDGRTVTVTVVINPTSPQSATVTVTGVDALEIDLTAKAASKQGECQEEEYWPGDDTATITMTLKFGISFVAGVICIPGLPPSS